jgi:hypothetical protein
MRVTDLTETERAVAAAFAAGTALDLTGWADDRVSAAALRFMLLGGVEAEPGHRAELWLTGAVIEGALRVEFTEVDAPIELTDCRFSGPISFFGSRLRRLRLANCEFLSIDTTNATFDTTVFLGGCTCAGRATMGGTTIEGSLLLQGTVFGGSGIAFEGIALRVRRDLLADEGFICRGAMRLDHSEVGGVLSLRGAVLEGSGDIALSSLHGTHGIAMVGLDDPEWSGSVALSGRHLTARELVLLPAGEPGGLVDLRHAKVGLLRDAPATWEAPLRVDGLTYEAVSDVDGLDARLGWLRKDPGAFRPQPYAQLASLHRAAGRDEEARTVLLAGEQHRREKLSAPGRWWGRLQDLTVGYGYRPIRAGLWLAGLFAIGAVVFGLVPPRAAEPDKAPEFVAPVYTLDLILPVIDFGQQTAYHPRGATVWLAYALIVSGLLLATTVAAAGARRLNRS